MSFINLTEADKETLLDVAKRSIRHGLEKHCALPIDSNAYNELLNEMGASFITLNLNHQLRGCIGTLDAFQPLVKDVADHAFAAAFKDPRFTPVISDEVDRLDIHISVLTKSLTIDFTDENDLLRQLQEGVDGLILQDGPHKATFLPSVWEQLPEPKDFLNHLKTKAGLEKNYWSNSISVSRYNTISF